jgi:methionyl aminopeptidase
MATIPIKNDSEIEAMRKSCRLVGQILNEAKKIVQPGITTKDVDVHVGKLISDAGAKSAFLGYRGFPANACVSVNEEVVHGIGSDRQLQLGDLLKLDVGVILNGWHGDSAISIPVGAITAEANQLISVTEQSLFEGIKFAREGNRLGDICAAIEKTIVEGGFSVVRDFVGHGLGRQLHEEPQIPNYGRAGTGPKLKAGMVLAIEPMVNSGKPGVRILNDGWTVVTVDGKYSSHFEHDVLITSGEPEILSLRD